MRCIFLLFFSIIISVGFSQTYYPLVKENAVWIVQNYWDSYPILDAPPITNKYLLAEDTIINGYTYKRLYSAVGDSVLSKLRVVAYLREDSNKRIFIIHDSLNGPGCSCHIAEVYDEHILYDFSLQVGDTMYYTRSENFTDTTYLNIINIDSILINNEYRKRFKVNYYKGYGWEDSWIEGIGSLLGLGGIYCGTWQHWHHWLACYFDIDFSWNPVNSRSCYVLEVRDLADKKEFNISPNPTNGILTVEMNNDLKSTSFEVYNMQGQSIPIQLKRQSDKVEIYLNSVQGIYLLKIQSEKRIWVEKIVLE